MFRNYGVDYKALATRPAATKHSISVPMLQNIYWKKGLSLLSFVWVGLFAVKILEVGLIKISPEGSDALSCGAAVVALESTIICHVHRGGAQSAMTTLLLTNLEFSKIGRIDSHLPNTPIMSASESFLKLTGYARNEVLGRRDRFLSGSDTDSCTLLQIDKCIQNGKPCKVRVQDCSGIVSDGLRLRISKFHILESLYQKTRRN